MPQLFSCCGMNRFIQPIRRLHFHAYFQALPRLPLPIHHPTTTKSCQVRNRISLLFPPPLVPAPVAVQAARFPSSFSNALEWKTSVLHFLLVRLELISSEPHSVYSSSTLLTYPILPSSSPPHRKRKDRRQGKGWTRLRQVHHLLR